MANKVHAMFHFFTVILQDVYASPKKIPGFDRVQTLAEFLVQFRGSDSVVSKCQAERIVELWKKLDQFNRSTNRPARHQEKLTKGRFKTTRVTMAPVSGEHN